MTNPFAETETRQTPDVVCSTNPYATPVDTGKGAWDHTLLWRLAKIVATFALFFIVLDAAIYIAHRRKVTTDNPVLVYWMTGKTPDQWKQYVPKFLRDE